MAEHPIQGLMGVTIEKIRDMVNAETIIGDPIHVDVLGDDPCQIIRVNSYRWEIEDCFRVEKSDLNMRPVYVRSPKRIAAHFFICFLSLLIRSERKKIQ